MLLWQRLDEMTVRYTDARAQVAKFLLEQKKAVNHMSMQQIADATYTSKATLVRIAKGLSYSGWTELIRDYIEELYSMETQLHHADANIPFEKGDSTEQILNKVGNVMAESIVDTIRMLEPGKLERSARILKDSGRIAIYCLAPNTILAELFCRKMLLIGRTVELMSQSDQAFGAASLKKGDCAILISYSGSNQNRTPMRFIKELSDNQVSILAITGKGNNYLRQNSDITFTMSSMEKPYSKIATFATEESINTILNALYSCYFALDYDGNLSCKLQTASKIEQNRYSGNDDQNYL